MSNGTVKFRSASTAVRHSLAWSNKTGESKRRGYIALKNEREELLQSLELARLELQSNRGVSTTFSSDEEDELSQLMALLSSHGVGEEFCEIIVVKAKDANSVRNFVESLKSNAILLSRVSDFEGQQMATFKVGDINEFAKRVLRILNPFALRKHSENSNGLGNERALTHSSGNDNDGNEQNEESDSTVNAPTLRSQSPSLFIGKRSGHLLSAPSNKKLIVVTPLKPGGRSRSFRSNTKADSLSPISSPYDTTTEAWRIFEKFGCILKLDQRMSRCDNANAASWLEQEAAAEVAALLRTHRSNEKQALNVINLVRKSIKDLSDRGWILEGIGDSIKSSKDKSIGDFNSDFRSRRDMERVCVEQSLSEMFYSNTLLSSSSKFQIIDLSLFCHRLMQILNDEASDSHSSDLSESVGVNAGDISALGSIWERERRRRTAQRARETVNALGSVRKDFVTTSKQSMPILDDHSTMVSKGGVSDAVNALRDIISLGRSDTLIAAMGERALAAIDVVRKDVIAPIAEQTLKNEEEIEEASLVKEWTAYANRLIAAAAASSLVPLPNCFSIRIVLPNRITSMTCVVSRNSTPRSLIGDILNSRDIDGKGKLNILQMFPVRLRPPNGILVLRTYAPVIYSSSLRDTPGFLVKKLPEAHLHIDGTENDHSTCGTYLNLLMFADCGIGEILSDEDFPLSLYIYVQRCLKHRRVPVLQLTAVSSPIMKLYIHKKLDKAQTFLNDNRFVPYVENKVVRNESGKNHIDSYESPCSNNDVFKRAARVTNSNASGMNLMINIDSQIFGVIGSSLSWCSESEEAIRFRRYFCRLGRQLWEDQITTITPEQQLNNPTDVDGIRIARRRMSVGFGKQRVNTEAFNSKTITSEINMHQTPVNSILPATAGNSEVDIFKKRVNFNGIDTSSKANNDSSKFCSVEPRLSSPFEALGFAFAKAAGADVSISDSSVAPVESTIAVDHSKKGSSEPPYESNVKLDVNQKELYGRIRVLMNECFKEMPYTVISMPYSSFPYDVLTRVLAKYGKSMSLFPDDLSDTNSHLILTERYPNSLNPSLYILKFSDNDSKSFQNNHAEYLDCRSPNTNRLGRDGIDFNQNYKIENNSTNGVVVPLWSYPRVYDAMESGTELVLKLVCRYSNYDANSSIHRDDSKKHQVFENSINNGDIRKPLKSSKEVRISVPALPIDDDVNTEEQILKSLVLSASRMMEECNKSINFDVLNTPVTSNYLSVKAHPSLAIIESVRVLVRHACGLSLNNVLYASNKAFEGYVYCQVSLLHGECELRSCKTTRAVAWTSSPRWVGDSNPQCSESLNCCQDEWLDLGLSVRDCPPSTRVCFSIMLKFDEKSADSRREPVVLGWVNVPLFDHSRAFSMLMGTQKYNLWTSRHHDLSVSGSNPLARRSVLGDSTSRDRRLDFDNEAIATLFVTFASYPTPILFVLRPLSPFCGNTDQLSALNVAASSADLVSFIIVTDRSHIFREINSMNTCVPDSSDLLKLQTIVSYFPTVSLSPDDQLLVWKYRYWLLQKAWNSIDNFGMVDGNDILWDYAVCRLSESVPWGTHTCVSEAHFIFRSWPNMPPLIALSLLQSCHADVEVRALAARCVMALSDEDIIFFMPQLVLALTFEVTHISPLAAVLFTRAIRYSIVNARRNYSDSIEPKLDEFSTLDDSVGSSFFWKVFLEMHRLGLEERCGLLLQSYLRWCSPNQRQSLCDQIRVINDLGRIAVTVKASKGDCDARTIVLQENLKALSSSWPSKFRLPLISTAGTGLGISRVISKNSGRNSTSSSLGGRWCRGIDIKKCRVLKSNTKPLFLVFSGCTDTSCSSGSVLDGGLECEINVIFKQGDDLRQDELCLQLFQFIDSVWRSEGLVLPLCSYACVSTGPQVGIIEVVNNSITIGDIVRQSGGVLHSLSSNVISDWIVQHAGTIPKLASAQHIFTLSCAAYCVITYILGVTDRHNDNIMIHVDDCRLFHIDFGHFLGNVLYKFGFKRERSPFVFTPAMADVMSLIIPTARTPVISVEIFSRRNNLENSPLFRLFTSMCTLAFSILRRHSHASSLLELLLATQHAGMPELNSRDDVKYVLTTLMLDTDNNPSEEDASNRFKQLIADSLSTTITQINDLFHLLAN